MTAAPIKTALLCLPLSVSLTHSVFALGGDCVDNDCTAPAYELRIINHGEAEQDASNATSAGRQQNRRADVSIVTEEEIENVLNERQAAFDSGGTVWVSQEPSSLARLLKVNASSSVNVQYGQFEEPVEFTIDTNYFDFIKRWEIVIWRAGQSDATKPLHVLRGAQSEIHSSIRWDGSNGESRRYKEGEQLEYALRVYDENDAMDQTRRQTLSIKSEKELQAIEKSDLSTNFETLNIIETDLPELKVEGIKLYGSKVRVYGQGFDTAATVTVNGEPVSINVEGKFAFETIKQGARAEFIVRSEISGEKPQTQTLVTDLEQQYFFMVGMADLTVGENQLSGNIEVLEVDQQHYGGDLFVDGRLAFYLKGKIKGKYLLTAQMDTGTEDIDNLFDDFHKKDPRSIFRRLDPDQYYPVYGDDSNLRDDTNSQGKLYVRLEWDRSWALWGNYNTAFNGTELAPFNRSLYGAQLFYRDTRNTKQGDTARTLSAFASQAQSLFRQSEFIGTGGSLYYLRDSDIVSGSEKIWVEVRRDPGGRVVQKVELVPGRDYEIDYFQGRIILQRPLVSVTTGGNPSIIRDQPLAGDLTWLVVDYEFTPRDSDVSDATAGVRGKQWLGDHVAIGGTWAHETREQQDYDIKGVDLTLKQAENTYLRLEVAQSEAAFQSARFSSNDGGLSFVENSAAPVETSGKGASIEAQYSLQDKNPDSLERRLSVWAKQREAGFATSNDDVLVDTSDVGVESLYEPVEDWGLYAKAQRFEEQGEQRETIFSGKVSYTHDDWLKIESEYQHTLEEKLNDGSEGTSDVAAASIAADVNNRLNLYAIQQVTVNTSGSVSDNDLSTVGAKYQVSDSLKFNAEASTGDRGDSALLGADWWYNDTYQMYSNLVHTRDRDDETSSGIVLGQRKALSNSLKVYSEHQFTRESKNRSFAHTIGLDNRISEFTSITLSFQAASLLASDSNEDIDRNTLSAGIEYQKDKLRFSGKYEYRRDKGQITDLTQWVTTNRFEYRRSVSLRWQGKFNASRTMDENTTENARFIEAGFGFAYRPITHDRLNMLGRLTYLHDLQPASQSTDSDQRSIIASTEALYDVSRYWSIGGKLAHRVSEIRIERNAGPWIANDASLFGVRVRRHVPYGIDLSASYRWLWSDESDGVRQGALLTAGKRVGQHLTFSVGYNFTDFDDNLANDNYDVKGWFLNFVGTY